MLSKVVSKGGQDLDTLLGPVLFVYRSTLHLLTGMSPFYLLYGCDLVLATSLNFQASIMKYLVIEIEYGKEIVRVKAS